MTIIKHTHKIATLYFMQHDIDTDISHVDSKVK